MQAEQRATSNEPLFQTMLIHATVTITGDAALRGACEARLRRLLSTQFLKDEVTEHHGAEALCYDLKVEGGIPFPAFAQASQEFPELVFSAEWVNVAAGEKGSATLVQGRLAKQSSESIATRAGDEHPVHLEAAPDGRLMLALTLLRVTSEEWRGYALTASRDALLRVVRRPGSPAIALYATEGAAEWSVAWSSDTGASPYAVTKLESPVAIAAPDYSELEAVVRRFVSDWIWFSHERREDIAVELDRYARRGLTVSGANLRASRLHRILADIGDNQVAGYTTLAADELWLKDLVLATWARLDEA